jgi:hypothetical protein
LLAFPAAELPASTGAAGGVSVEAAGKELLGASSTVKFCPPIDFRCLLPTEPFSSETIEEGAGKAWGVRGEGVGVKDPGVGLSAGHISEEGPAPADPPATVAGTAEALAASGLIICVAFAAAASPPGSGNEKFPATCSVVFLKKPLMSQWAVCTAPWTSSGDVSDRPMKTADARKTFKVTSVDMPLNNTWGSARQDNRHRDKRHSVHAATFLPKYLPVNSSGSWGCFIHRHTSRWFLVVLHCVCENSKQAAQCATNCVLPELLDVMLRHMFRLLKYLHTERIPYLVPPHDSLRCHGV